MAELVACLSTGKGTWGHVARLVRDPVWKWDRVVLVASAYAAQNFVVEGVDVEFVVVDENVGLVELREGVKRGLKERVKGSEVAVNFVSGSGREHMALVSALVQLGVGIRFVAVVKDGVVEM